MPTGPAFGRPDDRLRTEPEIQNFFRNKAWIPGSRWRAPRNDVVPRRPRKIGPQVPFWGLENRQESPLPAPCTKGPSLADPLKHTRDPLIPPPPAPGGIAARARAAAGAPYLDGLNPEQREAVVTLDGAVLVLAGAGTGKTRVLTTRIVHILRLGRARPSEILAVTFTNKAAREMKLRVGQMVGEAVEGMPWLGTFHAIGVKILRRHAELVGLKPNFTILDVDDQIRLLKQLLQAEDIDEKRWPARVLAGMIDGWKAAPSPTARGSSSMPPIRSA